MLIWIEHIYKQTRIQIQNILFSFLDMLIADDQSLARSFWFSFVRCVLHFSAFFFSGLQYYSFHKFMLYVWHVRRIWTGVSLFVVVLSITVSIIMMITTPRPFFFLIIYTFFRCPLCSWLNHFFSLIRQICCWFCHFSLAIIITKHFTHPIHTPH